MVLNYDGELASKEMSISFVIHYIDGTGVVQIGDKSKGVTINKVELNAIKEILTSIVQ